MQEATLLNQPIKGLQLMLKTISYALGTIPVVNPDGIFDATTEAAVRAFQRTYQLPVTGIVDETTFRTITEVYRIAEELIQTAQSPVLNYPATLVIAPGQAHPHIYLVQAMFTAIHEVFSEFYPLELNGILDPPTERNLRRLQELSGIPVTGSLDKQTWNRLALCYRVLFDRERLPSQG